MADEIRLSLNAQLENGFLKDRFNPGTLLVDQNTLGAHAPIVDVGTSEEDMPVGDVATLGYLILQNLDATNFVDYGPKNGSNVMEDFARIYPGEFAVIRLKPGITLRWVADTAAVNVQMKLWNH